MGMGLLGPALLGTRGPAGSDAGCQAGGVGTDGLCAWGTDGLCAWGTDGLCAWVTYESSYDRGCTDGLCAWGTDVLCTQGLLVT
jgi:hypothetical protein